MIQCRSRYIGTRMRWTLFGLCAGLLYLIAAPSVWAADRHVPAAYPTIQAAINAAAPGDSVLIADGTYSGPGNINLNFGGKDLVVRSASGNRENCIINCAYAGHGFEFTSGETSAARIEGLTIAYAFAPDYGGGINIWWGSPTITNCHIIGGWALDAGGALHVAQGQSATVNRCRFTGNSAYRGGAVTMFRSSVTMNQCEFYQNSASWRGGAVEIFTYLPPYTTQLTMNDCVFKSNYAAYGACGLILDAGTEATIRRCTFENNVAQEGGGFTIAYGAHATVRDSLFALNSAYSYGGGAITVFSASANLSNCIADDNYANFGGGFFFYNSTVNLTNCTITSNFSAYSGGGIGSEYSAVNVRNSILWDNGYGAWDQVVTYAGTYPTVSYSDIQSGWSFGTGNIVADPLFVNNSTSAMDNNLHLMPNSPCVGMGTSLAAPATDLDGVLRKNPPDIGAYEVTPVTGIQAIIARLNLLVTQGLELPANSTPLLAKLNAALAAAERGNNAAAQGSLNAFTHQLDALIKTGKVNPEQGQPLVDAAKAVIRMIRD